MSSARLKLNFRHDIDEFQVPLSEEFKPNALDTNHPLL
jgi:hypothetical protein